MPVRRYKGQIVFESDRCDPGIIIRDGGTGAFKLNGQALVLFGRFAGRKQNCNRLLSQQSRKRSVSAKQVGQQVGIEGNFDFHFSGSMARPEAITASKSESGTHSPARPEKSVCLGSAD